MNRYKKEKNNLFKVAMYLRLSQEDKIKRNVESNSIENQRRILKQYIDDSENLALINEYVDDGYSGTSFNRPGFQKMLDDIHNKKIDTIIVKDLSRFGRNYIEVGKFLEETFPMMKIRFISIIDKIDSFENPESSSSMLVNFKNLINDEYARDISRKVKSVYKTKQLKGEYIASAVPFGYKRDPNDKYHLVIDKEVSDIVKLIFELALNNKSALEIAEYLNDRKIITPNQYRQQKGIIKKENIDLAKWSPKSVTNILTNEVYTGTTVQNKKIKMSYKIKKDVVLDKEKWIKVPNTHEALVSKEDFDWIQEKYYTKIIHVRNNHKYSLFAGFLICNECHRGFNFCTKKRKDNSSYNFYQCGSYKLNKTLCTSHTISEEKLKNIIIEAINHHIKLIKNIKLDLKEISKHKKESIKTDLLNNKKIELEQEIEKIMEIKQEIYTDWKNNNISFDDYKNYTSVYADKVKEIRSSLELINKDLEEINKIPDDNQKIFNIFLKENKVSEIDRDVLFKFIDKIIISEDKKIEIIFKFQDIFNNLTKYISENKN